MINAKNEPVVFRRIPENYIDAIFFQRVTYFTERTRLAGHLLLVFIKDEHIRDTGYFNTDTLDPDIS